jgi:hypothetical protein
MPQANDPSVGHHKIFLKWNPSSSASQFGPNGLAYCLYRTQAAGTAKNCPTKYAKCEQVNVEPVRGTRCVDDLVKDTTTYYYVALAITSANGKSTTSEEAIAQVPAAGKDNPAPVDADSYAACRTAATPTQPATLKASVLRALALPFSKNSRLKALLTWTPEGSIVRENNMPAVLANLAPVGQNFHGSKFPIRNTIGTPRRFFWVR